MLLRYYIIRSITITQQSDVWENDQTYKCRKSSNTSSRKRRRPPGASDEEDGANRRLGRVEECGTTARKKMLGPVTKYEEFLFFSPFFLIILGAGFPKHTKKWTDRRNKTKYNPTPFPPRPPSSSCYTLTSVSIRFRRVDFSSSLSYDDVADGDASPSPPPPMLAHNNVDGTALGRISMGRAIEKALVDDIIIAKEADGSSSSKAAADSCGNSV